MLHIKKLMGMHNKETYTCVYMRICVRIYSYMCTYGHMRIRKIRSYDTRMRSSLISELHCSTSYAEDLWHGKIDLQTPGIMPHTHF